MAKKDGETADGLIRRENESFYWTRLPYAGSVAEMLFVFFYVLKESIPTRCSPFLS